MHFLNLIIKTLIKIKVIIDNENVNTDSSILNATISYVVSFKRFEETFV